MKKYKDKKIKKLKSEIFRVLIESGKPLNHKQIQKKLTENLRKNSQLLEILYDLVKQKKILIDGDYKFYCKKSDFRNKTSGNLEFGENKKVYCRCEKTGNLILIPKQNLKDAFINDYVLIKIMKNKKGKIIGKVDFVTKRFKEFFVGTYSKKNNTGFVLPIDKNIKTDFYIPDDKNLNANHNDRVIVRLLEWPKEAKCPFGEITELLGVSGNFEAEVESIIRKHNIKRHFSKETLNYVTNLNSEITENDIKNRKDFREHVCFTIDPEDAKDFDDAISLKKINKNIFELGIHIADVSHYVKTNTSINKEAMERGCSVYLANKVVPMLPEKLANKLCSLRPLEDKLCFSIVFNINNRGEVISNWIGKTIIKSKKRFTYEEAQNTLDNKRGSFYGELSTLDNIAKKLRKKRIQMGSVILEKKEIRIKFENEKPIKPYFKNTISTNKLVEEFMLLANQFVCEYFTKKTGGVYRVHDQPDLEKLNSLSSFLKTINVNFNPSHKKTAQTINELLIKVNETENKHLINQLVLNSMAKAQYTTKNIGHFGLGFEKYSHFTSPIRRYPDVLVHRILNDVILNQHKAGEDLETICVNASKKERFAIKAEREYLKFILLWLVKDEVGQIKKATITSIKEWGIYAELHDHLCEGMISISSLKSLGNFYFCQNRNLMINKIDGQALSLGDELNVKISKINLQRGELDLIMI